jgi:hypothetical protein
MHHAAAMQCPQSVDCCHRANITGQRRKWGGKRTKHRPFVLLADHSRTVEAHSSRFDLPSVLWVGDHSRLAALAGFGVQFAAVAGPLRLVLHANQILGFGAPVWTHLRYKGIDLTLALCILASALLAIKFVAFTLSALPILCVPPL